jgi:hypothetical protein
LEHDVADTSWKLSRTIHRIFLMLYAQFAFYWGVVAIGMLLNYYYAVPATMQPTFVGIVFNIVTTPLLIAHVSLALASTAMSVPIIIIARRIGLTPVAWLHVASILVRLVGFVGGPLFMYNATTSIANVFSASLSTFAMATALIVAVILTFMSRIFIVREDVRIKYGLFP